MRAAILMLVFAGPAAAATLPPFKVLLQTGDRASDGLGVATIGSPVAGGPGEIFFRGTTSAVLEADGGVLKTVAACGDPLPAPYAGVFGSFVNVVVNDAGAIAFTAALDSPVVTNGLFLREGATLTAVSLVGSAVDFGPGTGSFDLNVHGDIVTRSTLQIQLWVRATGQTTTIAEEPARTYRTRFTGKPVIGAGGHVAWLGIPRANGDIGGVYTWAPATGVVAVTEQSDRSTSASSFRTANVAINDTGRVAWVVTRRRDSAAGAFVWDPDTRLPRRLAAVGDLVEGHQLTRFGRFVGIDAQGTVVFLGSFGGNAHLVRAAGGVLTSLATVEGGDFPGRLPDSGRVVWVAAGELRSYDGQVGSVVTRGDRTPAGAAIVPSTPSVNDAGAVAFVATHEALLRLADGVATPVAQAGDPVPGGDTIATLGPYAAGTGGLAFFAATPDGRQVLLRYSAGALTVVTAAGAPSPLGGTFALTDELPDAFVVVGGSRVGFLSRLDDPTGEPSSAEGVFVAGKRVQAVAQRGDPAPGGGHFTSVGVLAIGGNGVVFSGTLDGDPAPWGLFRAAHRRTTRIAVTGQAVPDSPGHRFSWFSNVVAAGERVLFVAGTGGDLEPPGLFLWARGRLTRLRTDATTAGAATDPPFVFDGPVALAGRQAFVLGGFFGPRALYRASRRPLRPLVTADDVSPVGGALSVVEDAGNDAASFGYAVSPRGDRVTVVAPLLSGRARAAILSREIAGAQ